ncbi:MAG: pirin family protein [Bdellovibrionales bacterium]|nr:pirin family protein [Bdellovibrionales bacterium]
MGSIERVIQPIVKDLGDNFQVRRSLPTKNKKMIGPFIFWDHMGPVELSPDRPMTVRAHPHIGLATITYLLSGQITHRDSLGNEQAIRPGEVNWMTAGSGIVHSERSDTTQGAMRLEGIQLWLALPKEFESVDPNFFHGKEADLPIVEKEGIQLRLIAGEAFAQKSPVPVFSDLFYINGKGKKGGSLKFVVEPGHESAVYIINGSLVAEGEIYRRFDMLIFKKGEPVNFAIDKDCEFMLFGGQTFAEDRHIWWNFVSTSRDKINKAKKDWREGNFPKVINETEWIPLPGE